MKTSKPIPFLSFLLLSLSILVKVHSYTLPIKNQQRRRSFLASATIPVPSNAAVVGDADRAFDLGIELEKSGLARAASTAFHEAATLYQCYLDNYKSDDPLLNDFGHVTTLSPEDCATKLAYACVRLAHLNHDALGDSNAAIRLYKEAASIDPHPSSVSFDGIGTSIEASGGDLADAIVAYREALRLHPESGSVLFHLAVALERLGEMEESNTIMEKLRRGEANRHCLVDSWGYARWHCRRTENALLNLHRGTRDMLQLALDAAAPLILENGLVCEFGVASGRSTRMLQEMLPLDVSIYGFDTFTGLPKSWGKEKAGSYSTGGVIPNLEGKVMFYKGLFRETIPEFLDFVLEEEDEEDFRPLAFANIDCDLYTSTYDVLEGLHSRIVPGTVLVFDEYLCHPTWRQDEFRAWRECCKRFGWQYEYLGFSLSTKQAVVRVT